MGRIWCYPQPGKAKAMRICTVFAEGCGGSIVTDGRIRPGAAVFYGIGPGMEPLWRDAHDGRDWYLIDNSYFDSARETYFRVTKNRLQHSGIGESNGERFRSLGIEIKPWRTGEYIVLCPQSEHFMRVVAGYAGNWLADTTAMLRRTTQKPIKVRPWLRDKAAQVATIGRDLESAHALVTWSSAAAITAVLSGVPIVCASQCAAYVVAGTMVEIESPRQYDRQNWANVLADNQFTVAEMANGMAWLALNG